MDSTLEVLCTSCEVNSATQVVPLLFLWGWAILKMATLKEQRPLWVDVGHEHL